MSALHQCQRCGLPMVPLGPETFSCHRCNPVDGKPSIVPWPMDFNGKSCYLFESLGPYYIMRPEFLPVRREPVEVNFMPHFGPVVYVDRAANYAAIEYAPGRGLIRVGNCFSYLGEAYTPTTVSGDCVIAYMELWQYGKIVWFTDGVVAFAYPGIGVSLVDGYGNRII